MNYEVTAISGNLVYLKFYIHQLQGTWIEWCFMCLVILIVSWVGMCVLGKAVKIIRGE